MKKRILTLLVMTTMFSLQVINGQTTFFVTELGQGTKDGSSWQNASDNLTSITSEAQPGDTVWVAQGTYQGGFVMKEGISVFGGFSGNETCLNERKLPGTNQNLTILDGNNNFRVLSQNDAFTTTTIWDGFVIQNGVSQMGAGVLVQKGGVLRRCIIRNNNAGLPAIGEYSSTEGGIIFRIDVNTKKAWVIATDDYGRTYSLFETNDKKIEDLETALADMNGNSNTTSLSSSRAIEAVKSYTGKHNDWYLPSAGEWGIFIEKDETNQTYNKSKIYDLVEANLSANGFTTLSGKKYWTSTTTTNNDMWAAWYIDFSNDYVQKMNVWQYNKIRGIRSFDITDDNGQGGGVYAAKGSCVEGCLIMENSAAAGSGIYAKGNAVILNNTIVKNIISGTTATSAALEANSVTKVYNTVVAGNTNKSGDKTNYNSTSTFFGYSAVETSEIGTGESNILLSNIESAKFSDPDSDDYSLLASSPLAEAGNTAYLSEGLDSDLANNLLTKYKSPSIGAFWKKSDGSSIENDLLREIVVPNLVKVNEIITIDLSSLGDIAEMGAIELYNLVGQQILSTKSSLFSKVQMPNVSGVYILKIITNNKSQYDYKIIVKE